ncbi:MAG TPA: carbamate kinase [Bacillota bacterium]|nr:carbamate kinase [Bacillota bacterium]
MGSHRKVVIALGGNALQDTHTTGRAEEQFAVVKRTAEIITDIKCIFGYELAVVHGNGPQIGRILLAYETAAAVTPVMPLNVCTAMSQGYIGYHLQQGLSHALANRNRPLPVVTLITQVVVDPNDPAFLDPTKPIGPFYSEEDARRLGGDCQFIMREDAGRGWRRVVASPMPKRIVEIPSIKVLWDSTIVIAAGGGGIPVFERSDGTLEGAPAVIDKDLAAEKLAEEVGADILMILTAVDRVCLHYQKANQIELTHLSVTECERYIEEGHFAPGSMLPKIQAGMLFANHAPGKKTIITSLEQAVAALSGKAGTEISG